MFTDDNVCAYLNSEKTHQLQNRRNAVLAGNSPMETPSLAKIRNVVTDNNNRSRVHLYRTGSPLSTTSLRDFLSNSRKQKGMFL